MFKPSFAPDRFLITVLWIPSSLFSEWVANICLQDFTVVIVLQTDNLITICLQLIHFVFGESSHGQVQLSMWIQYTQFSNATFSVISASVILSLIPLAEVPAYTNFPEPLVCSLSLVPNDTGPGSFWVTNLLTQVVYQEKIIQAMSFLFSQASRTILFDPFFWGLSSARFFATILVTSVIHHVPTSKTSRQNLAMSRTLLFFSCITDTRTWASCSCALLYF